METVKLSAKYQMVVPLAVRRSLGLKAGEKLYIESLDDSRILLTKSSQSRVAMMRGLGSEVWKGLGGTAKYIKEERASWKKR